VNLEPKKHQRGVRDAHEKEEIESWKVSPYTFSLREVEVPTGEKEEGRGREDWGGRGREGQGGER